MTRLTPLTGGHGSHMKLDQSRLYLKIRGDTPNSERRRWKEVKKAIAQLDILTNEEKCNFKGKKVQIT